MTSTLPDDFLSTVFDVNGVTYPLMTPEERARQVADVARRHAEVDKYIRELDATPKKQVECIKQCMKSFTFWCDHFCYTFDPRDLVRPYKRFILYDFQIKIAETIIKSIREGTNIHLDKSRDMGMSWLMMSVFTWMWLMEPSFHAHVGSRVEKLVDDYTLDSLFGKIDVIISRLPLWMTRGKPQRKLLCITHPQGNLITGESANQNFARGPRKNVVYMDEFAFWEHDRQVWVASADTAPCHIVTSTPFGMNTKFAELKFMAEDGMIHLSAHWTQHPLKDLAWYKRELARRKGSEVSIAQELNINYRASSGKLAITSLQDLHLRASIIVPDISTTHPSNTGCRFFGGLDWGSNSPTSFHVYRVRALHGGLFEVMSVYEYYEPSSLPVFSTMLKSCPWSPLIETIYADPSMWFYNQQHPSGVTSIAYLFRDIYHISLSPGQRGDHYALEQINIMTQEPVRFLLCESCVNQIRELDNLRYEIISDRLLHKRNESEKLVDKDNHCYDAETEVLTRRGFILFKDLKKDDRVYTLQGFQKPIEILSYDYHGEMYSYRTKRLDFCVTPEHRMWVANQMSVVRRKSPNFNRVPLKDIDGVTWISQHLNEKQKKGINWSDDLIKWFGFWLAEGCKSKNHRGSHYAHIDQNYDPEIEDLLIRLGGRKGKVNPSLKTWRYTFGVKFYRLICKQGLSYQKFIPRWMLNRMNKRQLNLLLEWMIKGDGTCNDKMWRYNTSSKILADNVQELCFRVGVIATISIQSERLSKVPSGKWVKGRQIFHVNIRKQSLAQIRKNLLSKSIYKGKIYCVNTRSGVIFVRRNGKAFWCGQSWDDLKYFFNTRFPKPDMIESPVEIKMGYSALKEDFKEIRKQKLEKLQASSGRRRMRFR